MKNTKNMLAATFITGAVFAGFINNAVGQDGNTVRPFRVNVPEEKLLDLKRRILATQWPEKENVKDQSQGVQLATMQALAKYWTTTYDWRKVESRLNALPQFITTIDGVDIHFVHVRSKYKNALPIRAWLNLALPFHCVPFI